MKRIENLIESLVPPKAANVAWVDTSNPNNIELKVLVNGNWVALSRELLDSFAAKVEVDDFEEFDITTSYTAGGIVRYKGRLYKFTSNKSAGAWDSTKVSGTNVMTLVYDNKIQHGTSDTTGYTLVNNRYHIWGTVASLDLSSLAVALGEYAIQFTADTGITVSVPEGIEWGDDEPTFTAGNTYQIVFSNGFGYYREFAV